MALAIATSPAAVKQDATTYVSQLTTASFTPAVGSLLLMIAIFDTNYGGDFATPSTVTGSTSTWHYSVQYNPSRGSGDGGLILIAWATVNSAISTTTRVNFSDSSDCAMKTWVLTGANNTNPIGRSGTFLLRTPSTTTLSYTATAAGSISFFGIEDWANGTIGLTNDTADATLAVNSAGLISHQTTAATGVTTQSFVANYTTDKTVAAFVEIVPAAAVITPPTNPGGVGGGATQANTMQLLVNGVDRTVNMVQDQWTLTQQWGRQGDTATILLHDEYTTTNPTFVPQVTQTVQLKDVTLNQVIFGGIITKPELDVVNGGVNEWTLNCQSYAVWADSRIVSYAYHNTTLGAIIADLTQNAQIGLSTVNVVNGPTITAVVGQFEPLSKAWSKVCALASTQTTYGWWVDGNKTLYVADEAQALASGVTFDNNVTTSHLNAEGHYEVDFKYDWDATSLANRIYAIGGNITQQQSDNWTANGHTRQFALTLSLDSSSSVQLSLSVGGLSTVVSTQNTDPWYLAQDTLTGLWNLIASTTTNTPTPVNGTVISLTYGYLVTQVSVVQNTTSIAQYGGLNGGFYDATITDTTLMNLAATQQRGQHEVAEYGYAQEQVTFTTTEDWQGWLNVGQTIVFKSSFVPDSGNSYHNGLNEKFLVVSMSAAGTGGGFRKLQITAVRVT